MTKDEILSTILSSIEDSYNYHLIDSNEASEAYGAFSDKYIDCQGDRRKACEMGEMLLDVLNAYIKASFAAGFNVCKELLK